MTQTPSNHFQNYLRIYALTTILASLPLLANLLFLKHAHEIDKMANIVRLQTQTGGVYGAALVDNTYRYKQALIQFKKPVIVALGSSKMMPFQEDAFTQSFVNAGGGMHQLNEGLLFLNDMFQFHSPKILMIGLDPCWFNAAHPEAYDYPEHDYNEADITREKLLAPYAWLLSRKITWRRYINTVSGRNLSNPYTHFTNIGFMAIENSNGFRSDGSRFYGSRYAGKDIQFNDVQFANTRARLNQRCCEFESGSHVDAARFQQLRDIVSLCDKYQVKTVFLLTPAAPSIDHQMQSFSADFGYVLELQGMLNKLFKGSQHEYYDFSDLSKVGSTDCECVDGSHGGNTAYYRILRWIITHHPTSILNTVLDARKLNVLIDASQGKTMVLPDLHQVNFKEEDFLQLGCKK